MKGITLLLGLLCSMSVWAQHDFKVMTYNLLNYGNVTSYCTNSNNSFLTKEGYLKDIIAFYKPDILGVNELASNSFLAGKITSDVFNSNAGWNYQMASYSNASGMDLINTIYYNANLFALANQHVLSTEVRDIILFRLYFKAEDLAQTQDTAFLNVVVSHLKAGSGSSDQQRRNLEVTTALNAMANLYPAGNYLWMGDLNVYKSSEAAFQKLLNPSQSSYAFMDPINTPGNWNNNSSYKSVHTQSTHSSSNGCASGGGLDDRFDFILLSDDVLNGNEHYSYVNNSYEIPGNDGNHFNQSITTGSNSSASASMVQTLYNMSDHLPVILSLRVDQTVGISEAKDSDFELKVVNPLEGMLELNIVSRKQTEAVLTVYDPLGKCMLHRSIRLQPGAQSYAFDSSEWSSGLFFLSLRGADGNGVSTQLIKL